MKRIIVNALIIIVTSLLFNTVGISFRVFLSNKIGTEGIGMLQLIFSVYMMATLFVVNGINVAVTRLVAEEGGRGSFSVSRVLIIKAVSISFLFSIPAFVFLYFGADTIGSEWLGDQRTVFSLKLLAVGMPFAGVSACIKGYFYAVSKVARPTFSQAIELIIQILIIVNTLDYFMKGGLEYACAVIAVGITISELASCLYIITLYWIEKRRNESSFSDESHQGRILKKLLYISIPISISSLIRSGLKTVENLMIPVGLEKHGYSRKMSLEEYGKIQGMVMPVLMFPASIILAFSALMIPEVSEANALNQKKRVEYSVTRALQLTAVMSILAAGIFAAFSDQLGLTIYNSSDCGLLMKILAPLIPLLYLDIVIDELLKGLNQQVSALRYNIVDALIKIILIYYLLPQEGLSSLVFIMYLSGIFNTTISMQRLLKITKLRFYINNWFIKPVLSVIAAGVTALFLLNVLVPGLSDSLSIVVGSVFMCLLYFTSLVWLGGLTKEDYKWLKSIFNVKAQSRFKQSEKTW